MDRKQDKPESGQNQPSAGSERELTDRQGHPITDNQSQRTVGSRGPATLENYHFH